MIPVQPDSATVARVRRARSQIVTAHPFFGALALSLELQERADVKTMCTDGARLAFNPEFVATLSEPELMGVVVHEVLHLAYLHPVRRGSRDLARWNEACDFAINLDVVAAGFKLPAGALIDARWKGMGAEAIFAAREAERDRNGGGKPDADKPGAGKPEPAGAGAPMPGAPGSLPPDPMTGAPDPGASGGVVDAAPDGASMEEAAGKMEARIRQVASVAIAGAGEMPGDVARIIGELNRPRFDWRAALARFVDDAASRATDWSRPDKRFLDAEFFMPARKADSVACLAVAVDTSGSISARILDAFASEVQAIIDSGRVQRVHVVFCDSSVKGSQEFEQGDSVRLDAKGGGGTRFAPAFAHIEAQAPDAAAIVYLTDLDASPEAFGPEPGAPVLWLQFGKPRAAPFGEVMPLDVHA